MVVIVRRKWSSIIKFRVMVSVSQCIYSDLTLVENLAVKILLIVIIF